MLRRDLERAWLWEDEGELVHRGATLPPSSCLSADQKDSLKWGAARKQRDSSKVLCSFFLIGRRQWLFYA